MHGAVPLARHHDLLVLLVLLAQSEPGFEQLMLPGVAFLSRPAYLHVHGAVPLARHHGWYHQQ